MWRFQFSRRSFLSVVAGLTISLAAIAYAAVYRKMARPRQISVRFFVQIAIITFREPRATSLPTPGSKVPVARRPLFDNLVNQHSISR
jgi:hypothetical protein